MAKKLIPDLGIDGSIAESGDAFGIDGAQIPSAANEIAEILAANQFGLRTSSAVLSRVLGWLAFQVRDEISPSDFLKAVAEQSLNYCGAFASRETAPD
jgi:hypothetical protein